MRSRASSGIPAPRSSTSISTIAPAWRAQSRTSLSGGEYFTAFETRLARMRSSASGSASTGGSADAQSSTSVSTAPRRKRLAVAASAASTTTDVRWSVGARPRSRRERSSRSLTIRPRRAASAPMIPAIRRTSSGASERAARISLNPWSAVSGVRSSCDATATKTDFARSSSSRWRVAFATCRSSSSANRRARDVPDVGRAQAIDEHGAHRAKRSLEQRHARQRPLDRQNGLVPRPLPARACRERTAEGADAGDERERHEPFDRLRREPRALDRGKHDGGVEDERRAGAQRAAEPAERERQRDDRQQIHVTERRGGVAAGLHDQRRDDGQGQRRGGGERARHAPVPRSRYAAKKRSAATPPGTRLPDHQKSQQFPALRSVR